MKQSGIAFWSTKKRISGSTSSWHLEASIQLPLRNCKHGICAISTKNWGMHYPFPLLTKWDATGLLHFGYLFNTPMEILNFNQKH
ncbi:hypothetical protein EYC54_07285 [Xanthomonas oryzae]|nr:hypothetical protein EYC54_07285 [Xanthomonas oryzae]